MKEYYLIAKNKNSNEMGIVPLSESDRGRKNFLNEGYSLWDIDLFFSKLPYQEYATYHLWKRGILDANDVHCTDLFIAQKTQDNQLVLLPVVYPSMSQNNNDVDSTVQQRFYQIASMFQRRPTGKDLNLTKVEKLVSPIFEEFRLSILRDSNEFLRVNFDAIPEECMRTLFDGEEDNISICANYHFIRGVAAFVMRTDTTIIDSLDQRSIESIKDKLFVPENESKESSGLQRMADVAYDYERITGHSAK